MDSKRILIADDVPANLAYLDAVLQGAGFSVDSAANGLDALEIARSRKPDLIVSDILMPEMDGFALCRAWKHDPSLRAVPFVFYTGTYVDEKDRQLAQSLGCDAFLVKPMEPDELLAAIRGVLLSAANRPDTAPSPNGDFLRQYNESLVRKLEDKMQQLERENVVRREAETALRENQARWAELFDANPSGLMLVEKASRVVVQVNPSAAAMIGLPQDQIVGKRCHGFMCPAESHSCPVCDLGQTVDRSERILIRASGERVPILKTVVPLALGGKEFLLESFIDVAEKIRAETALRESEDRFRSFVENANDIVYALRDDGTFDYVSPNWRDFLGHDASEIVQRPLADFIHPDDLDACRKAMALAMGGAKQSGVQYRIRHKDGSWRWHMSNGVFRPNPSGPGGAFLGIARDVTELRQADARRQLVSSVLSILNEDVDFPDAVRRILAALRFATGCDAAGMRLLRDDDFPFLVSEGFSDSFLSSENSVHALDPLGKIVRNPDGSPLLVCSCGAVLCGKPDPAHTLSTAGGSCWTNDSSELLCIPPGKDSRLSPRNRCVFEGFASIALVPIRAKSEIVGLFQLCGRDKNLFSLPLVEAVEGIANHVGQAFRRKQAEEDKERLQAQLHQMQRIDSVGRLAGGVAHDFNNMLQVILSHVELAARPGESGMDPSDCMREIQKAAERSAELTRQLLAFARKQTIMPRVLDLNDAVAGSVNMLRRLIGENIDLEWLPSPVPISVKMDPSQIDQILANLCVNARDAMPDGGTISIRTESVRIDKAFCAKNPGCIPGAYARLSVRDDGCGMDADTIANAFEPFFTTKPVGLGTGLGLSTVYGIVKQNQGFIDVDSRPGRGSTFRICLPRLENRAEPAAQDSPSTTPPASGKETILLVEDEPTILAIAETMLRSLGYRVLPAPDPAAALRLAAAHDGPIHLLLTDVIMPGMDGHQLADKLLETRPGLKRIYMSGYTADIIAHRGVLEEGVQFVQKPFSRAALAAKIRSVLDG